MILILNEARSTVDKDTENIIWKRILDEFVNYTLPVIAYRLSTPLDFDNILTRGESRVSEFGLALELVEDDYIFASMLKSRGFAVSEAFPS